MKIVIITNAMTPHQSPLCDALSNMKTVDITFIETKNVDRTNLPIGWRSNNLEDYVVPYSTFCQNQEEYQKQILEADAVILGGDYTHLAKKRIDAGRITFIYSERIYKSVRDDMKWLFHYIKFNPKYKYPNLYLLCASAFAYSDYCKIGCFKNRALKWGYFINPPIINESKLIKYKQSEQKIRILWASRLINWKHPELTIKLAAQLYKRGYKFEINMYGVGPLHQHIYQLIKRYKLDKSVRLGGEISNAELMKEMQSHDIFLFTSDRTEGWGVVANEAMANQCALVGSDAIGSIPYLVEDGINGMIFKSKSLKSLVDKVIYLIDNPEERIKISINAHNTIVKTWSPSTAAANFVQLVNSINQDINSPIIMGPCSKA